MRRDIIHLLCLLGLAGPLGAQGPQSLTDEIRLARSAAPAQVADSATVLVLRDGHYEVAEQGTSDVTCLVSRSRPGSLEPICYDAEASRSIMRIDIRRVELRLAGESSDTIDRIVAEAIGDGRLTVPRRPALAYMMSSGQVLISDDGRNAGAWYPHLMLYMPYVTAEELGLFGPPSMAAAAVFDPGLPTAHLVIAVREFVDP